MRALVPIALLLTLPATAQLGHDLPPVINLVGAGYNMEYAAKQRKLSTWVAGIGAVGTGILFGMADTRHTAAPWVVGGLTVGVSMSITLDGLKWQDRGADLLKCGYSPYTLYEMVPDSVGDVRPRPMRIPALIDGTPVKLPARMHFR